MKLKLELRTRNRSSRVVRHDKADEPMSSLDESSEDRDYFVDC